MDGGEGVLGGSLGDTGSRFDLGETLPDLVPEGALEAEAEVRPIGTGETGRRGLGE